MTKSDTMANTSMNVSLPETLKDYVQERVAEGTFSNPSDYVRALIREMPPTPSPILEATDALARFCDALNAFDAPMRRTCRSSIGARRCIDSYAHVRTPEL